MNQDFIKLFDDYNGTDYQGELYEILQEHNMQSPSPIEENELRMMIDEMSHGRQISTFDVDAVPFLTTMSKNGPVVIRCQENVLIAIRHTPGVAGKFRYNAWLERRETTLGGQNWRPVRDNDYNLVRSILANSYMHPAMISVSTEYVTNALMQYCEECSVDPARTYFSSLVWDNTPRLNTWLTKTFNAEDTKEHQAFGSQWIKGLVKRVMSPGCKFDHVLVLEGEQGIGKSTALSCLGGSWHVELTTNPNDKDFFMLMKGNMIVEFSEGEIQERASMKLLKSIITQQRDVYRAPYGREIEEHPRRCVFAMTTNDSKYLKDETGNRRWLPVECNGKVNIEWLQENRDQLFAEAYYRVVTLKESLFDGLYTDEVRDLQNSRRLERVEEELIVDWYISTTKEEKEEGFTVREVYDSAIGTGKAGAEFNQLHNQIIPAILKNILKLRPERKMKDGVRKNKFYPTEATYKLIPHDEFKMPQVEIPF